MYKKYVLADLETLERAYDVGAFYLSRHKKALMDVSARVHVRMSATKCQILKGLNFV
jgi:hypothetical protein